MALLTAYMARAAQFGPSRAAVLALFVRIRAFLRAVAEVVSEAHKLRAELARKHPFVE